jgi:hypothetical protein
MTDQSLTDELAERVLGWRAMPDRYVKSARSWLPKWRFQPLVRIEDAFQLLEASASGYRLEAAECGTLTAEISIRGVTAKATGRFPARTITVAVARGLGMGVADVE